jgi:TonB family protein
MTTLVSAISSALIHFLWQGSIVGVGLWFVLFALRNKSANVRYWCSVAGLAVMAVLPLVTTVALYSTVGKPILQSGSITVRPHPDLVVSGSAAGSDIGLSRIQLWTLSLWSLGAFLFSLRLVVGFRYAFHLRRRGQPAGENVLVVVQRLCRVMGIRRSVRLLMSEMADSPSVVGWFRPLILLPASTLMGLTPIQLEAILAHELAHVKRYDYLVNLIQMAVETLLFYHPAVWWVSKRMRTERELCCDDLAVRFSGSALRYARALTTLEKLRLRTPRVAMASTGGPLLYRIQRLVGALPNEYGSSRLPALMAISLGILCVVFSATWIKGQDAPGVSVDLGSSSVIHRAPVRYPESARKQGITGAVQLEVSLDSSGDVSDARVLTGPAELRKTALESVLNWHFTSEAARSTRTVTISFTNTGTQVRVGEPNQPSVATDLRQRQEELQRRADELRRLDELKASLLQKSQEIQLRQETASQQALQRRQQELELRQEQYAKGQDQLKELEAALRNVAGDAAVTEERTQQVEGMKAEIAAVRAKLAAMKLSLAENRGNVIAGRTVKSISAPGMSDSVVNDLTPRLPVRQGDTLSTKSLEQIAAVVRNYDEHLSVAFVPTDDGQVEIRIVAPNERR